MKTIFKALFFILLSMMFMFLVTLNKDFMAGMFVSLLALTFVGGIIAKNEKH